MKYVEKNGWKTHEKSGNLREAVTQLFDELRENCELVDALEPTKEKNIVRTLYYSVAYKRHSVMSYPDEKLRDVLEDLKVIRSYMVKEMKKLK